MKKNNKSNRLLIILISLFLIVIFIFVGFKILYKEPTITLKIVENTTFEINTEIKNMELLDKIEDEKIEILSDEENIDTSKLGTFTYNFKVKRKKTEIEYPVEYTIVDKTNPILEVKSEIIEIEEDTEINLLDNVTVTDNSKEELEVKIEGEYDIKLSGEYKVKLVSEDSSKNKTEKDFTIIVKEKPVEQPKQNSIVNTLPKNNSNNQSSKPSNNKDNVSSNTQNSLNNQSNSDNEYDANYLMKKADQLVAEGRNYGALIKQKVWTYTPNEINSHIPGATYPIYGANFYWQYIKYGEMRPGDSTVVDLYEWRVQSDMDEYRDVTGRPQMVHRNAAQSYLVAKPTKEGTPNEKVGNIYLYYTSGLGLYETKEYIKAGR